MSRLLTRQGGRKTLGMPLGVLEDSLIGEGILVLGSLTPHPGVSLVLEEGIQTFDELGLGRGELLGRGEVVDLIWVWRCLFP